MSPLPWTILNAIQLGVLLVLTLSYGVEAFRQRHAAFGLLVLGALFLGIRHLTLVFAPLYGLDAALVDRMQSPFALAGFVVSIHALGLLTTSAFPHWLNRLTYTVLLLNILRALLLSPGSNLDRWSLRIVLLCILAVSLGTTLRLLRSAFGGDRIANSLGTGFVAGIFTVIAEVGIRLVTGHSVPMGGFAYMLLSLSMVSTWISLRNLDLLEHAETAERESAGWRALLPGPSYRLQEASPYMENTFGSDWSTHLQDRMERSDRSYRIHRAFPGAPFDQGWVEELPYAHSPHLALLQGWSVGLGLDDRDDPDGIQRLLEDWGARVQRWGILPPRQGPFPSLLLWSREPSILAVWREDELSRRRCRWIQVGGAAIEGPHARLERPLDPQALHEALQKLLALPAVRPATNPLPERGD